MNLTPFLRTAFALGGLRIAMGTLGARLHKLRALPYLDDEGRPIRAPQVVATVYWRGFDPAIILAFAPPRYRAARLLIYLPDPSTMLRLPVVCLLFATAWLPTATLAQSAPETAPPWSSHTATDSEGTRNCAVFPVRQGPFPMIFFFGSESGAELTLQDARNPPMELTLQVDAHPALDGGVFNMSAENTATLIGQIRAGGQNLRLSQSALVEGKLERFHLDLPLTGAVEQLDTCRAWLAD